MDLCEGNLLVTGAFPNKWPVIREVFPYYDAFMFWFEDFSACVIISGVCLLTPLYIVMCFSRFLMLCNIVYSSILYDVKIIIQ